MRYLLAVVCGMSIVHAALGEEIQSIPVVKTWEELQAIKPIDLGDGVKIRLGLEAATIPQWSGALLYCLTEGYRPPASGNAQTNLGPVHVAFEFKTEKHAADQIAWRRDHGTKPAGRYLFLRGFKIDRLGPYFVTVSDRDGMSLARAEVTGTKDFFHPWMPWLESYKKAVCPGEGIALPGADGLSPADFAELGVTKKGSLPTFLPSDKTPALAIALEGQSIVVRAKSEFTTSWPEQHFLARWWVNGEPFVPKQPETLRQFQSSGQFREAKELRLEFEFHPERLGAKPGDAIGLQLMHSEDGWD